MNSNLELVKHDKGYSDDDDDDDDSDELIGLRQAKRSYKTIWYASSPFLLCIPLS